MDYIEKYKLAEIIPFDEIEAESKAIIAKFKKLKTIWLILSIVSGILFVSLGSILYLIDFSQKTGIDSPILFGGVSVPTFILLVVSIFILLRTMKKERLEKKNSAGARHLQNMPLETFYNRIIEFNPPLQSINVLKTEKQPRFTLNQGCEPAVKNFSFASQNFAGNTLEFTFKGKNFTFGIEYIYERIERIHNSKGPDKIIYYHTFMDTLVCQDLLENIQHKYGVFSKNRKSIDARWKKFESESVQFNEKFHTYYFEDEIEVFNLFNPLVLDKFNSRPLVDFERFYINGSQGVTYKCKEVRSSNDHTLNTLYGFTVTGNDSLVDDINENMARYEKNIVRLRNLLQYFVPFITDLNPSTV